MFTCERFVTLTRPLVIAIALASLPACAVATHSSPLQLVAPVPLVLGINEGALVPPDVVAHYCAYQRAFLFRAPVHNAEEATAAITTIASCPRLQSLWLVEQADVALVQQLAAVIMTGVVPWAIELGNELDLAGLTPEQFGAFVGTGRAILRAGGFTGHVLIGGIYTVDHHQPDDFAAYLAPAMAACPDCVVGLHWYGDTSDRWLARVQALGFPAAVTEFGMPSCTPAQETAQAVYVQEKLTAYARTGTVLVAILYQHNSAERPCDDSDASHLAHFGSQRPDRSYKPVDDVLAAWTVNGEKATR